MALTDGNGGDMVMPVAPMYGGGNGGFGNCFGGDWAWIILLLLLGWGNNGWGNNGMYGGNELYPWMNQAEVTNDGFRDQMMNSSINGIQQGVNNLSTQLCNCCSDVQMALANGFAGVEQGANARQIANMQQGFGFQTAMAQGFNQLGTQFADCCCENRLGIADLKYTIATENCADRQAINDGVQKILDQMCADKIDAKNDEIAQLRQEILFARGQASQIAQNSTIIDGIYNRLDTCPVGTTPVYGRTPIFTCNSGCGCGCGNNF